MKGTSVLEETDRLRGLIYRLKEIQDRFNSLYGVDDIYTNSKYFEIMIADTLNHTLIPGHSGTRDAVDAGGQMEYKHFKETSSNHSWTFNDFSDATIERLRSIKSVIFAYINDSLDYPEFQWYYEVPGGLIADYLETNTQEIRNTRKMINVSPNQIERKMGISRSTCGISKNGKYTPFLEEIFKVAHEIEEIIDTKGILTSNKLWEILVGIRLGHQVLSEQKQFDAKDVDGNYYEYKVARSLAFSFEDISEKVLDKFSKIKSVVMAVVDKRNLEVTDLYIANPSNVVKRLKEKLREKELRYQGEGKEVRRLQVGFGLRDLKLVGATRVISTAQSQKSFESFS